MKTAIKTFPIRKVVVAVQEGMNESPDLSRESKLPEDGHEHLVVERGEELGDIESDNRG